MLQPEVILPQDPTTVSIFAVHLSRQGFKVSTVSSYLSALGYVHRLVGAIDPVKSQVVQKLLSALQKRGQTLDVRCPMTLPIIKRLLVANKRTLWAAFEKGAMEAIMLVAFFGLFRLGELLLKLPNSSERVICLSDLKWEGNSVNIHMSKFKHHDGHSVAVVPLVAQHSGGACPIRALHVFMGYRGTVPGPLFAFPSGKGLSRSFFSPKLDILLNMCSMDTKIFKGHSFRIGGGNSGSSKGYVSHSDTIPWQMEI